MQFTTSNVYNQYTALNSHCFQQYPSMFAQEKNEKKTNLEGRRLAIITLAYRIYINELFISHLVIDYSYEKSISPSPLSTYKFLSHSN